MSEPLRARSPLVHLLPTLQRETQSGRTVAAAEDDATRLFAKDTGHGVDSQQSLGKLEGITAKPLPLACAATL
jgi:hypothetical protein